MQKHVNLVDLVKSFPTNIYLQNLASIQKRTSPVKFAHLAEKSENGSISNLSTKVTAQAPAPDLPVHPPPAEAGREDDAPQGVQRPHRAGTDCSARRFCFADPADSFGAY